MCDPIKTRPGFSKAALALGGVSFLAAAVLLYLYWSTVMAVLIALTAAAGAICTRIIGRLIAGAYVSCQLTRQRNPAYRREGSIRSMLGLPGVRIGDVRYRPLTGAWTCPAPGDAEQYGLHCRCEYLPNDPALHLGGLTATALGVLAGLADWLYSGRTSALALAYLTANAVSFTWGLNPFNRNSDAGRLVHILPKVKGVSGRLVVKLRTWYGGVVLMLAGCLVVLAWYYVPLRFYVAAATAILWLADMAERKRSSWASQTNEPPPWLHKRNLKRLVEQGQQEQRQLRPSPGQTRQTVSVQVRHALTTPQSEEIHRAITRGVCRPVRQLTAAGAGLAAHSLIGGAAAVTMTLVTVGCYVI